MAQRPGLGRAEGTLSDMTFLNTKKSKAIDMSHPPYTREYVEQYRQRIKGDPDPEVHFSYAKYLIEAAKKIGAKAHDQRAVRKYREMLLAEALKVIRRLATQGDAYSEAQFFLGELLWERAIGPTSGPRARVPPVPASRETEPPCGELPRRGLQRARRSARARNRGVHLRFIEKRRHMETRRRCTSWG
jgi:hypothetical protein